MKIILASQSPRRRELMSHITPDFESIVSDVEEICPPGLTASEECALFARQKCEAVYSEHPDCCVIGCDTVVSFKNEVLGKPKDKEDARRMINMLKGTEHVVYTAVCVRLNGENHEFICSTGVKFYDISDDEVEQYISTDEPYDKAGGYGIQLSMLKYVDGIDGDYYNVMGLPVSRLYNLLKDLKVI